METEVHGDDVPVTLADIHRMQIRQTRAILALRDELRASQAVPPKWITSRWRDIVYVLLLAAMAFQGDIKGALGYAIGSIAGAPPVVSHPSAAPLPAPESP